MSKPKKSLHLYTPSVFTKVVVYDSSLQKVGSFIGQKLVLELEPNLYNLKFYLANGIVEKIIDLTVKGDLMEVVVDAIPFYSTLPVYFPKSNPTFKDIGESFKALTQKEEKLDEGLVLFLYGEKKKILDPEALINRFDLYDSSLSVNQSFSASTKIGQHVYQDGSTSNVLNLNKLNADKVEIETGKDIVTFAKYYKQTGEASYVLKYKNGANGIDVNETIYIPKGRITYLILRLDNEEPNFQYQAFLWEKPDFVFEPESQEMKELASCYEYLLSNKKMDMEVPFFQELEKGEEINYSLAFYSFFIQQEDKKFSSELLEKLKTTKLADHPDIAITIGNEEELSRRDFVVSYPPLLFDCWNPVLCKHDFVLKDKFDNSLIHRYAGRVVSAGSWLLWFSEPEDYPTQPSLNISRWLGGLWESEKLVSEFLRNDFASFCSNSNNHPLRLDEETIPNSPIYIRERISGFYKDIARKTLYASLREKKGHREMISHLKDLRALSDEEILEHVNNFLIGEKSGNIQIASVEIEAGELGKMYRDNLSAIWNLSDFVEDMGLPPSIVVENSREVAMRNKFELERAKEDEYSASEKVDRQYLLN